MKKLVSVIIYYVSRKTLLIRASDYWGRSVQALSYSC